MGLIEKLPYLKQLGITAVELMPAYEFEECEYAQNIQSIAYQVEHIDANLDPDSTKDDVKINYWGFKNAFYFTPKSSYAATDDPCAEFKRSADVHIHQLRQGNACAGPSCKLDAVCRPRVTGAAAVRAGDIHVRKELHVKADNSGSVAAWKVHVKAWRWNRNKRSR